MPRLTALLVPILVVIAACGGGNDSGDSSTPETFDPYAGAVASVDAAGTMSEGVLTTSDGRTRHYRTYVPAALPAGTAIPLVIALHGGLGTSSQFAANSGLNDFAESNKFIAVYPDGIGNRPDGTGYQTWNGGYCCGPAATQAVDDVAFIGDLVAELRRTMPIDPKRVYAMGHSNGGMLSYKLACDLSSVIVAIGVQAGSNIIAGCQPTNPVSVFHLHGTADTNTPINGGKGSGVGTTIWASARGSVDAMAGILGCNVSSPKSLITSNPDVTALSWKSCKSNTEVRFVTVKNATHAWMGHAAPSAGASLYVGTPYPNLDATRAILSFLLSKSR
jgi:polyhydroxybutyrate depolymerase